MERESEGFNDSTTSQMFPQMKLTDIYLLPRDVLERIKIALLVPTEPLPQRMCTVKTLLGALLYFHIY
jgi:hypothetical protein